jgi:hypothetical protein
MNRPNSDTMAKAIITALEAETKRIVEEEAKAAGERTEQRVRAMAGQIATRVATMVSFEPGMQHITIKVHLPGCEQKGAGEH